MITIDAPYTRYRPAQYRGPSTSDDYNKRVEEYYKDLVVLVNRAHMSEVELDELYRRLVKDHLSIVQVIEDLESRIDTLEADDTRFTFHNPTQIDVERFDGTNFEVSSVDRLSYDGQYGILTLPKVEVSSLSKLFYVNTHGMEVVSPTLETRIVGTPGTADSTEATIDSSPPELALYKKSGVIWERNVIVDEPNVNGAELTLYVKVPTDLYTTNKTNAMLLHPFPSFGTTVREVAYTTNHSPLLQEGDGYIPLNSSALWTGTSRAVGWVPPGGWTDTWEGEDAAVNAGPKLYYFEPEPVTAFKVRLHQPTHHKEAGRFIYTYGLSQLDLRFDKFLGEGTTMVRFDAPEGQTISSINNVQPQIFNVSQAQLWEVFEYRTIWETSFDTGEYTTEPQPNSNRVWLEITLKNTPDWTPALSGLSVDYS